MQVALVHDDLVQWGGAERILFGLSEIFPEAPIYTSLYDRDNKELQRFRPKKIVTSFLQKLPGWRLFYKQLLPFYSLAFEQFDFSEFDLVISHSTRFAKSIVTKPTTKHICYCHTPPRFLWHFSGEKSYGFGELLLNNLRIYDQVAARRVDAFIAGSKNAKERIRKIYKADSKVVYPFVDLNRFTNIESFDGEYFVVLGRQAEYKRVDLAIAACTDSGLPLKVVGGFRDIGEEGVKGVDFLANLDDEMVVNILAGSKALIICAEEDFGLTSLEAQALGKPVIAFRKGGALETIVENKTGIFFSEQTKESLMSALLKIGTMKINPQDCKKNAAIFSKDKFIKNFTTTVSSLI